MDKITPDPHDRFFKETFGRKEFAVPFLQGVVPAGLGEQIDWSSLEREESTFLDEILAMRSSDLLFSAKWLKGRAYLYCLFEHQSTSDWKMPLRMLRYMVRIWDRWERDYPAEGKLPLIVPIVLYQGRGGWKGAPDLRSMVAIPSEVLDDWQTFVPMFTYPVVDVSEPGVLERFADWNARHILTLLAGVLLDKDQTRLKESFAALDALFLASGDDLTYLRTALTYLFQLSGDIDKKQFQKQIELIENHKLKEETMSIAELLRSEGLEQGLEQGLNRGESIGAIRELQSLLGQDPQTVKVLAAQSDGELSVQRELLETEVRKRLNRG